MIGLVASSRQNVGRRERAERFWTSQLFRKAAEHCRVAYGRWAILSPAYGLVLPGEMAGPHGGPSLQEMRRSVRAAWADGVVLRLHRLELAGETFALHAGRQFVELLTGRLVLTWPVAGMGIGEQLQWYDRQMRECRKRKM